MALLFKDNELSQLLGLVTVPVKGGRKPVTPAPKRGQKSSSLDILKSTTGQQQLKTMNFVVKSTKQPEKPVKKGGMSNTSTGFNSAPKTAPQKSTHRRNPSNVSTNQGKDEVKKTIRKERVPVESPKPTIPSAKPRTPLAKNKPVLFKSSNKKEESKTVE